MSERGSLKLPNAGEWRLGFTRMTDYARASQFYRRYQYPDEREVAVVRKNGSLKLASGDLASQR